GRIIYYFGDDVETREDHTLSLPIKVRAQSDAESIENPIESSSESDEPSTPGFAAVVAVIGLLLAYVRRRA
ncbi:MAG: PGF-CTERM sorting domain-containing protein, partial [Euryarchaeota archaeon]|nr:PGF-CTERM sorting domain-containing protein [Euryarchaeota archaeon]